ncbi:hypothetical protein Tco_0983185 [Tanacetum coccineum]
MAEAEMIDSEETEEEKVDSKQAGADQATKDDQAGAQISETQKEKPEVPPSSSSLSLSSNYAESHFELELKKILFDKMDKSQSYMSHDKHQELFDALLNSIMLDKAIASGDVNPDKVLRKRDRRDDQDPTAGSDQGKQKRRKGKDYESYKDKVQTGSSSKEFKSIPKAQVKDLTSPVMRKNKVDENKTDADDTEKQVREEEPIQSMVDVPIHQEDPTVQRTPLVDTVISVLEKKVEAMPKRAWTKKDQKWTDEMVKMIDNLLLERRFKKSLECFVGGRTVEIDYRLLTVLLNFKVLSCILSYEYVNM